MKKSNDDYENPTEQELIARWAASTSRPEPSKDVTVTYHARLDAEIYLLVYFLGVCYVIGQWLAH